MAYRSVRRLPPRGSTAWGAQQFLRVLDDEERIAAERERLLAMGWRPPTSPSVHASAPGVVDERAYAELIERDFANRRTLEDEARRRASRRVASEGMRGGIAGGRDGLPIPERLDDRAGRGPFVLQAGLTDRVGVTPPGYRNGPEHPQAANAALLAEGFPWGLGAVAAGGAVNRGGSHVNGHRANACPVPFGWSPDDLWPPYVSPPPQSADPEEEEDFTEPLPGYPDQSDELRQFGHPSDPIPLPADVAQPPQQPPLSQLRPEPLVRISLQGILDRFFDAGILTRWETESTRQDNDDIIKMVRDTMLSCGWVPGKTYGAAEQERRLENDLFPGTKGDRFMDGSVEGTHPDGRKVLYDFNTAEELKRIVDGRRWVAYERRADDAIRFLKQKVDDLRTRFDVYPKSRGMDRETWRESVRPYVQEAVRALLDC